MKDPWTFRGQALIHVHLILQEVEQTQADASVVFSNIGWGPIGSTYKMAREE